MATPVRILIADDEVFIRDGLREALTRPAVQIDTAADGAEAQALLADESYDLVILDLRMPGATGMEVLEEISQEHPDTHTIMLTAHGNVSTAVEAMKKGAYDFLSKPVDIAHLRLVVERALDRVKLLRENRALQSRLESRMETEDAFRRLVRRSAAMQKAARTVKQVALSDVPVRLRGETGAGKELIARTIHDRSRRSDGPFVAVNCGGFTEDLFSSELFGHRRGAYTGAHADRPGRFALAEKGTLFLDEIGEVPLKNQVELLRALESREYQPLGDTKVHTADVRIIAATNRDLEAAMKAGRFRDDLYYRLNVVPVDIPPLRQRREDIPVLVETFFEESCRAYDQPRKRLDAEAMELLVNHSWPGNVRELRNVVQRLVVTSEDRTIRVSQLPEMLGETATGTAAEAATVEFNVPLGSSIEQVEANLIRHTLERITSNRRRAAEVLGISVRSLQYKLKRYGIT
ncbi:MAG: sigma-54 dependent transcriptional regulator [Candidatus Latescibacterota bacterium]|nr:sigma-54 dependent transcriptional regulator [Candidatus Latescibacterota bacterium]